jgi:hypothetical protein
MYEWLKEVSKIYGSKNKKRDIFGIDMNVCINFVYEIMINRKR